MPKAEDLPPFQRAVSYQSQRGQRVYATLIALRLSLLLVAAIAGVATWKLDNFAPGPALAAGAFAATSIVEVFLLTNRPNERWYVGRALSESIKSLTWRFTTAADPFPRGAERLGQRRGIHPPTVGLDPGHVGRRFGGTRGGWEQITEGMRTLRAASLAERRAAYLTGRLEAQRAWYAERSLSNRARATRWSVSMLVLEIVGVTLAVSRAAGLTDLDLLGVAAAAVAAGAAWTQTRQHGAVATAYALASQELAAMGSLATRLGSEAELSRFVNDTETAISREHTMWRARRRRDSTYLTAPTAPSRESAGAGCRPGPTSGPPTRGPVARPCTEPATAEPPRTPPVIHPAGCGMATGGRSHHSPLPSALDADVYSFPCAWRATSSSTAITVPAPTISPRDTSARASANGIQATRSASLRPPARPCVPRRAARKSRFSASAVPTHGWNDSSGSTSRGRQPVSSSTSRTAHIAGSLVVVDVAAGQLPHPPVEHEPVPPHQQQALLLVEHRDHGGPGRPDHVLLEPDPVGQLDVGDAQPARRVSSTTRSP